MPRTRNGQMISPVAASRARPTTTSNSSWRSTAASLTSSCTTTATSGLLAQLADNFGAGTIGIVLAHEYGHAIQQRSGVLRQNLPTVTTEQQADCFAGAWAGRAARGEGGITFSDADVRAGLIAMLEVRDPVGIDQFARPAATGPDSTGSVRSRSASATAQSAAATSSTTRSR